MVLHVRVIMWNNKYLRVGLTELYFSERLGCRPPTSFYSVLSWHFFAVLLISQEYIHRLLLHYNS
jgi:hypothetical protein